MPEGIDNIFHFGDNISFSLGGELADSVRSEAIFENTDLDQVLHNALSFYVAHQKMKREGWTGPLYRRAVAASKLTRWLTKLGLDNMPTEETRLKFTFDTD